ncbi:MAG: zf-TFIIB domain-containing protein [Spirochaetaceae bacterium]|nr:zf-TFIIB domain-containing protein [Myxococcales bacterium]MCB9724099.1 zf-TFIIB domain-containing protein [Spirochaetaceae bacterium]
MKLVACTDCHTQFDVSGLAAGEAFECRCGATLEATPPRGEDATAQRCQACGAIAKEGEESCAFCGSGITPVVHRGSLICPECYARNLDEARFCLGCGVAFDPHAPRPEVADLRCPCCERWMSTRTVGSLVIQECSGCHGIWAPDRSFDALIDRATAAARERATRGEPIVPRVDGGNPAASGVEYRRCPVCEALMTRRNYQKRSGVIIDRCTTHGTWLDAHELERIAGFVLSGRAEQAARAEAVQRAEAERDAARRALHASTSGSLPLATHRESTSIFVSRGEPGVVETVFDLLTWLLR